jgi:RNA polymerase sigma-70 factor (sigma-E family)
MPMSTRDEEFSAFVRTRRVELLRSACLLTSGDTHAAEDLVQTALARLYLAWPKVRRSSTQTAYTWRIMINAHLDEVRRPRWRREQSVPDPPDQPAPETEVSFPAGIDGDTIRAALAELPAGMRAAVVLRHWADFSVEDAARLLNCSEGTVKSQTAKGIARLRTRLAEAAAAIERTNQ